MIRQIRHSSPTLISVTTKMNQKTLLIIKSPPSFVIELLSNIFLFPLPSLWIYGCWVTRDSLMNPLPSPTGLRLKPFRSAMGTMMSIFEVGDEIKHPPTLQTKTHLSNSSFQQRHQFFHSISFYKLKISFRQARSIRQTDITALKNSQVASL